MTNPTHFNRALGKEIADKYLADVEIHLFASPLSILEHSYKTGEAAYELAKEIIAKNPEFEFIIDPEIVGFIGYVHNIGYKISQDIHELHTIYLLENKEHIPPEIAIKTRHGQLVEQHGKDEEYFPVGIEGIILTYIDISLRDGETVTMDERATEIEEHIQSQDYSDAVKEDLIKYFEKALPRYQRYERIIKTLIN